MRTPRERATGAVQRARSVSKLHRTGRNLFARLGLHFSWVINEKLGGSRGPRSRADLVSLKREGVKTIVRLLEAHEAHITPAEIREVGLEDYHVPIRDFTVPTQRLINRVVGYIDSCLTRGIAVDVSCNAGIGRTGVILACYLMHKGYSRREALNLLRKKRHLSPLAGDQKTAIETYWRRVRSTSS